MTAVEVSQYLDVFVQCFTEPGFRHFAHFVLAHAAQWAGPHCVTETLRLTRWHTVRHWTTPYVFQRRGRWSCRAVSAALLTVILAVLRIPGELVFVIDDTLVKKSGRHFFGLGLHRDPTDKNPGASKRRVWGHQWVVLALLYEAGVGRWYAFPLAAYLFVPLAACTALWPYISKVQLATWLLAGLARAGRRVMLVVDAGYAKRWIFELAANPAVLTMVTRLRCDTPMYDKPAPRRKGQRGRPAERGTKRTAQDLWRRRSLRRTVEVHLYGKRRTLTVAVADRLPSRSFGSRLVRFVIFPHAKTGKMIVLMATDTALAVERILELYGARFKLEDAFDELKTHGGFGDYRVRSATAMKRHVTLTLVAYSLLRLFSVSCAAESLEAEPWWRPTGRPSVTRARRALARALGISLTSCPVTEVAENATASAQCQRVA